MGDERRDPRRSVPTRLPYDRTVSETRDALAEQGFGVLTEIDVRGVMRARLGVDVPAQVILGACRPELAHRVLAAAPALATMLPCNVVVRADTDGAVTIESVDPVVMAVLADDEDVAAVAREARSRLWAALDHVRDAAGPDD